MIPGFRIRRELQPPKKMFNFLNKKAKPKYYKRAIRKYRKDLL